jgi:hypothetical protein
MNNSKAFALRALTSRGYDEHQATAMLDEAWNFGRYDNATESVIAHNDGTFTVYSSRNPS